MAGFVCQGTVVNEHGDIQPNAQIDVARSIPGLPPVAVYSDRELTSSLGSQFNADSDGFYRFFVPSAGEYHITATLGGFSRTWQYVLIGVDHDAAQVAGLSFSGEAETSAPPSANSIRANHATLASADHLFIADQTLGGSDISARLQSLAAGDEFSIVDPSTGAEFLATVVSAGNESGYTDLEITGGGGALTAMPVGTVKIGWTRNGLKAGLAFRWETATSGDPGDGKIRLNHATPASATEIAIDDLDRLGVNREAWLQSIDNSTNANKARIRVYDEANESNFVEYLLTAAFADQTGYWTGAVSFVDAGGTLADDANVRVTVAEMGDEGVAGGGLAALIDDPDPTLGANLNVNDFLLVDANDNEILGLTKVASAVNYPELRNAATGNNPRLAPQGDDVNIGFSYSTKGTGAHLFNGQYLSIGYGSAGPGALRLEEDTDNGAHFTGFIAPSSLAASVVYQMPSADGAAGQVLGTNGAAVLSWVSKARLVASFTPLHNQPPAANYATLDTRNSHPVLDHDTTTQEISIFAGVIPDDYPGNGLTVTIEASLASATSGTLAWDAAFENLEGLDIDADSFASAKATSADTVPATSGQPMRFTLTFSNSEIDGLGAGDAFRLRIRRDVANDNAAGDAELLRVKVEMI